MMSMGLEHMKKLRCLGLFSLEKGKLRRGYGHTFINQMRSCRGNSQTLPVCRTARKVTTEYKGIYFTRAVKPAQIAEILSSLLILQMLKIHLEKTLNSPIQE